eukprot:2205852-Rhodomonas_salina.3
MVSVMAAVTMAVTRLSGGSRCAQSRCQPTAESTSAQDSSSSAPSSSGTAPSYVAPGTRIGFGYAMSGTDILYAPTRRGLWQALDDINVASPYHATHWLCSARY